MTDLDIETTDIPGLLVLRLPVHADPRGWFKENWQRAKMTALGLPDFGPVQQNVSFNLHAGTTRGIHAEPWDKLVSVITGRAFGAWVDLREGPSFGALVTREIDAATAVFVPRGVGNSFQTLEERTTYSYLVNDHWRADAVSDYTFVNLADPDLDIHWPIDLASAEMSSADREHPALRNVTPFPPKRTLVLGAAGQLGRALREEFPEGDFLDRGRFDLASAEAFDSVDWRGYDRVINAAAFTGVDAAESSEGRRMAWAVNADAVARLARLADEHRFTLVHVSTDYVFDGVLASHGETEPVAPLGVYGQSKAAGELAAQACRSHYIVRTSWVIGQGKNFVRTMVDLAAAGVSPTVVDDQFGRPTFADELARGIRHLLDREAPVGIYHLSNSGPVVTWADLAREVFALVDAAGEVVPVTAEEYARGKDLAPRPRHSTLDMTRLEQAGFSPQDWREALRSYVTGP